MRLGPLRPTELPPGWWTPLPYLTCDWPVLEGDVPGDAGPPFIVSWSRLETVSSEGVSPRRGGKTGTPPEREADRRGGGPTTRRVIPTPLPDSPSRPRASSHLANITETSPAV